MDSSQAVYFSILVFGVFYMYKGVRNALDWATLYSSDEHLPPFSKFKWTNHCLSDKNHFIWGLDSAISSAVSTRKFVLGQIYVCQLNSTEY